MLSAFIELCRPILAFGEERFLSSGELVTIGVVAGIVALVVVVLLVLRMQRKGNQPRVESCAQCGSMSIQHRAGLIVCVDCGHSVKIQEAEA